MDVWTFFFHLENLLFFCLFVSRKIAMARKDISQSFIELEHLIDLRDACCGQK